MSDEKRLAWMRRPEGGGYFALWLIRTLALTLGRPPARLVLYFVSAYFVLRRGPERRASRSFLTRALGRPATLVDVWRHMHTFAVVTLDRVFLMSEAFRRFEITTHGVEAVQQVLDRGQGGLLISAHLGSFDALRILALERPDVPVRAVIDVELHPSVSRLLNALNPSIAASIINARQSGVTTALAISEALREASLVTLLADRARPGNQLVDVDLLGARAKLPTAPWLLAAALKAPVVLCFGIYRGGKRYELYFETFSESLVIPRSARAQAVGDVVQRFADRLSHYAQLAPFNWFNFYDLWE